MRVLFVTLPAMGHFLPLVPLAAALRTHGHEVSFAASPLFAAEVEARGFTCHPAGRPWLQSDFPLYFPQLRALGTGDVRTLWAYQNVFAGPPAAEVAADIVRIGASERFQLVVFESTQYAGCVAAETLGIPHVAVGVSSNSSDRRWVRLLADQLSALREGAGLPPDPDMLMPFRYLFLSPVPSVLLGDADLPASYHEVRMESYDASSQALPRWLEELPERPTVYLTLGTVQNKRPDAFRTVIDGLAGQNLNLVVTTGADQDPAVLGDLPENTRAERFVAQGVLLPRCSAVVSHGGSGTLRAALWFGLPGLLMPHTADQPRNAAICRDLGVARTLEPAETTPDAVREAVAAILHEPGYRESALQVSRQMHRMPDVSEGVRLLEELVGQS